jgi:hypothetical protein
MICGKDTMPSVPLCFCEDCRKNRQPEVQARREQHKVWFAKLIKERNQTVVKEKSSVKPL